MSSEFEYGDYVATTVPNSSMYTVKNKTNGVVPNALDGMFTSINAVKKAIDALVEGKKPRMSKVNNG